jgi:hypothetical protein
MKGLRPLKHLQVGRIAASKLHDTGSLFFVPLGKKPYICLSQYLQDEA